MPAKETPEASSNWMRTMPECLAAAEREQAGSPCPVVDHELVPAYQGSPDDIGVWLICRTKAEKRTFSDTEQARFVSALRKKMLTAGIPEAVVASLSIRVSSREEIDAAGGRLGFFR